MPGERFHVSLVSEEGGPTERVVVEVGMEGFNVLSTNGQRTLKKYPLHHISRWSVPGNSLILFTRSPVDVEDCRLTLQGDEHTIRSVLDTLTSCCMQMAELLQNGQGSDRTAAHSLQALLRKSKKAESLPTADQVEFWREPEKTGWMYSQGEHIKTWRKRWFILKQGFLFRFSSEDVGPTAKPRGIVDLSQVTDVSDGTSTTGRANSIKLSTATGSKCYLTDSETAQVEWISALENSVARIVKIIAGVDDQGPSSVPSTLAEQLQRSYSAATGGSGGGGGSSSEKRYQSSTHHRQQPRHQQNNGSQMIEILNYNGGYSATPSDRYQQLTNGAGGGYVAIDHGAVAGARPAMSSEAASAPSPSVIDRHKFGVYGQVYTPSAAGHGMGAGGMHAAVVPLSSYEGNEPMHGGYPEDVIQQQQQQYEHVQHGTWDANQYQQHHGYYQQQDANQYQQHHGYYQQQQLQQQPYSNGSGNLMDTVTAPQEGPVASGSMAGPASPWQVHYTGDGRPYYYNSMTGITTWDDPSS